MIKQQTIIQKIREACDELQELSFGCEVVYDNKDGYIVATGRTETKKAMFICFNESPDLRNTCVLEDEDIEIIGHEPHLEHLLRCLKDCSFVLEIHDDMIYFNMNTDNEQVYDLTKTLQQNLDTNPELVDFLYEILV